MHGFKLKSTEYILLYLHVEETFIFLCSFNGYISLKTVLSNSYFLICSCNVNFR